jgi:uncharacterized protein (TIGR03067 family)
MIYPLMLVVSPITICFVFAIQTADDDDRQDLAKLQGTWTAVSFVRRGETVTSAEKLKGIGFVVKDNKYYQGKLSAKHVYQEFKLDAGKTPKEIDFVNVQLNSRTVLLGIYDLDGDRLKLCYAAVSGSRPTEFTIKRGDNQYLWILERQR